jgi:hypothetical protein
MTVYVDRLETGWIDEDLKIWFDTEKLLEIYYNMYEIISVTHVGRYNDDLIVAWSEK